MKKRNALADLMVKLSMDPALRQQYQEDPSALLAEADLSDEELAAVAGGNPEKIRALLGGDAPATCFILFVDGDERLQTRTGGEERPL